MWDISRTPLSPEERRAIERAHEENLRSLDSPMGPASAFGALLVAGAVIWSTSFAALTYSTLGGLVNALTAGGAIIVLVIAALAFVAVLSNLIHHHPWWAAMLGVGVAATVLLNAAYSLAMHDPALTDPSNHQLASLLLTTEFVKVVAGVWGLGKSVSELRKANAHDMEMRRNAHETLANRILDERRRDAGP